MPGLAPPGPGTTSTHHPPPEGTMELTFYRTVDAHEVEPGGTLLHKRIVVDQIIHGLVDGEGTYLFRGYAPGYKRRQTLRVKAGEPVQLALDAEQCAAVQAVVDGAIEQPEVVHLGIGYDRTFPYPPAGEDVPDALDSTADAVEDWARTQGDG